MRMSMAARKGTAVPSGMVGALGDHTTSALSRASQVRTPGPCQSATPTALGYTAHSSLQQADSWMGNCLLHEFILPC